MQLQQQWLQDSQLGEMDEDIWKDTVGRSSLVMMCSFSKESVQNTICFVKLWRFCLRWKYAIGRKQSEHIQVVISASVVYLCKVKQITLRIIMRWLGYALGLHWNLCDIDSMTQGNLPGRCSFYECKIHNTPELPLLIRDTIVAKNSLGKMGKTEKNLLLHLLWEFLTCWIVTLLCSRYLTRKRNYWKKYNIPYEELSLIFGGASKFVFKVS